MELLNSYDKSQIDLFSFFKNEVSKVTLGNFEGDDNNQTYLKLLTSFRLPKTSTFLNDSLLKLTQDDKSFIESLIPSSFDPRGIFYIFKSQIPLEMTKVFANGDF